MAPWWERWLRSSDGSARSDRCLCLDRLGGSCVLIGEPAVAEMQVDARRRDRAVTGLGLERLDSHAALTEPGEARVAQLMAGAMDQPGPGPGCGEHGVEPVGRQWLASRRALEGDEHPVRGGPRRAFGVEVVG